MSDLPYSEYENMYPETVLIRKEGYFYMVRRASAAIIHAFFHFRGWKSNAGEVSIGFGITSLDSVCSKLSEEKISYAILVKGEIVDGKNFGSENRFNEFISTDMSDIPYKAEKNKATSNTSISYSLTDEEKKLCDISIKYLERLLEGRHPVNNSKIEMDTILTDQNVQRCFSFIADILKKVNSDIIEVDEQPAASTQNGKLNKTLTFKHNADAVIDRMVQPKEISMTELGSLISSYRKDLFEEEIAKITVARISNWLVDSGYLIRIEEEDGNHHREASEAGKIIGMTNNLVSNGTMKPYVQYRFTPKAQRFIFENLPEIAIHKKKK